MDSRVRILNKHLRKYDRDLISERVGDGRILISRMTTHWLTFEFEEKTYTYSKSFPIFVIALTDNWLMNGTPVDWGIEPILLKLKEMDAWRDDSIYSELVKDRERKEDLRKREQKNNMKAAAYDMRRDFARATNDVNTSCLKKIDKRRIKDGYC